MKIIKMFGSMNVESVREVNREKESLLKRNRKKNVKIMPLY